MSYKLRAEPVIDDVYEAVQLISGVKAFHKKNKRRRRDLEGIESVFDDPSLPISRRMARIIVKEKYGLEMAYWLHKNRIAAEIIAGLPEYECKWAMGLVKSEAQKLYPTTQSKRLAGRRPACRLRRRRQ